MRSYGFHGFLLTYLTDLIWSPLSYSHTLHISGLSSALLPVTVVPTECYRHRICQCHLAVGDLAEPSYGVHAGVALCTMNIECQDLSETEMPIEWPSWRECCDGDLMDTIVMTTVWLGEQLLDECE